MTVSATMRKALLAALLLALALCWVHPELVFQRLIYASADAEAANAFSSLGRAAQAEGEVPLWNPFVFAGMPSYASFAYLPDVYPLQAPLRWLVDVCGLPPMTWMLVHVWLFGLGLALYLHWRGLSWAASSMAGLSALVLPPIVAWGVHGHGTKIGTIAWWPYAVWALEWALRRGSKTASFAFGAALAMMLLRYHVQMFYYGAMALLVYGCVLCVQLRRERGLPLRAALLLLACLCALGLSAQIYLPAWEYQAHSIRGVAEQGGGATYEFATNWSLAPAEIATFFWPTAFGYGSGSYVGQMPFTDYPNYLGLPIAFLVLAALVWRRGAFVYTWSALALLSLLISFGKHGGLFNLFFEFAPFFNKFRVPSMILALLQFALLMVAAEGLDAFLRRWSALSSQRRRAIVAGCALPGIVFLFLATIGSAALEESSLTRWRELRPQMPIDGLMPALELAHRDVLRLSLLFLAAAAVMALTPRRFPAWAMAALLAVVPFLDLYAVTTPIRHPEARLKRPVSTAEGVEWVPAPALLAALPVAATNTPSELATWLHEQEQRPRVWPIGVAQLARQNDLAAQRIVNLGGYHAAKLQVAEEIRRRIFDANPPAVQLVNLLAARWVIVGQRLDAATIAALAQLGMRLAAEPGFAGAEGIVYENLSAQPRAFVVERYELATVADATQLDRIAGGAFDARTSVLLEREPSLRPQSGAAAGSVSVEAEGFDWVRLRTQLPTDGLLVLADMYYPGWEARVDGQPSEVLRADYALRAIAVPAGEHNVEFRISGGSYAEGRRIALGSGALLALLLLSGLYWDWRQRLRVQP